MEGLRRRAPFVQAVSVNGDSLDFPCPLPAHRTGARAARVEGLSEEQAAAEEAARKEAEATIAVAEALTLLEKGAARAELREMAPRPRPGAVSGERAWKIE